VRGAADCLGAHEREINRHRQGERWEILDQETEPLATGRPQRGAPPAQALRAGLISRRGFLAQRVPIFPPTASKARQTDPNVPNTAVAGRKLGAPRQALPLEASSRGVGAAG
jgi:hypothetical protein